jgi:hypothetical protein
VFTLYKHWSSPLVCWWGLCYSSLYIGVHPWFVGGVSVILLFTLEFTPGLLVGSLLFISLVLCVVLCFVFVLCLVYSVLPLCLDFPFLIGPSVLSNVYSHMVWFSLWCLTPQYFGYIVAVNFIGGGNRNTRRKPLTCHFKSILS